MNLPFYDWKKVEKFQVSPVVVEEGKPVVLPRPDPAPIALPIKDGGGGALSFSWDSSVSPPTIPMSAKFVFLGAVIFRSINPRLKESAQIPDLT